MTFWTPEQFEVCRYSKNEDYCTACGCYFFINACYVIQLCKIQRNELINQFIFIFFNIVAKLILKSCHKI